MTITENATNNHTASGSMDFTRVDLMSSDASRPGVLDGTIEHMRTTLSDLPHDLLFYGLGTCHRMVVGHRDPTTGEIVIDYPKKDPDPMAVCLLQAELGLRGR